MTVLTQLAVATAKSCSQGSDDLPGANLVIVNEELLFLPAYGLLWAAGVTGRRGDGDRPAAGRRGDLRVGVVAAGRARVLPRRLGALARGSRAAWPPTGCVARSAA